MSAVRTVHFVVPAELDDPAQPTGGNVYDHRIHHGLVGLGWQVVRLPVPGSWPSPGPAAEQALGRLLRAIPDGGLVLIDDLVACALPRLLVPAADRVRLVVLVHNAPVDPQIDAQAADALARAGTVLTAARSVVTTSSWTRNALIQHHPSLRDKVHVAQPGVDGASLARGTPTGGELLCVAAVTAHKGHDVVIEALASVAELPWRCVCVGALDREPALVAALRLRLAANGIGDRVAFVGVQTGSDLDRAYAAADALVLASHGETYGMVVAEALARGLPAIVSSVGGLPEALGRTRAGGRPGLLVPPGDSTALAEALRRWLTDASLRARLREAARERRSTLSGWDVPVQRIAQVLTQAAV